MKTPSVAANIAKETEFIVRGIRLQAYKSTRDALSVTLYNEFNRSMPRGNTFFHDIRVRILHGSIDEAINGNT